MSEMPPIDTPPIPQAGAPGLPWEAPNAGLSSIVPTALRIVTSPVAAFTEMSQTVDLVRPIAYFVLWALLAAGIGQIWNFFFYDSFVGIARTLAGAQFERFAPFLQKPGVIQVVMGLVVAPLVALIVLFIWSAIVHLMLTLLGGANRGFATTLRVMCYAETTQLAAVLPGIGGVLGILWRLILDIIGLSQAHKTEGWKAALAVLLPLVFCCGCIVVGAALFGAALAQAIPKFK